MTRSFLFLLCACFCFGACGDARGDDARSAAATPTPPARCAAAPAPIRELCFHTLQLGSAINSPARGFNNRPLTGAFSTSLGYGCTPQIVPCLWVENVRLNEANLLGFGATTGFGVGTNRGTAGFELHARGDGTTTFTGTVVISPGQIRFDLTDVQGITTLVLIGDTE